MSGSARKGGHRALRRGWWSWLPLFLPGLKALALSWFSGTRRVPSCSAGRAAGTGGSRMPRLPGRSGGRAVSGISRAGGGWRRRAGMSYEKSWLERPDAAGLRPGGDGTEQVTRKSIRTRSLSISPPRTPAPARESRDQQQTAARSRSARAPARARPPTPTCVGQHRSRRVMGAGGQRALPAVDQMPATVGARHSVG